LTTHLFIRADGDVGKLNASQKNAPEQAPIEEARRMSQKKKPERSVAEWRQALKDLSQNASGPLFGFSSRTGQSRGPRHTQNPGCGLL
jgi:hypothetical protein